MFSKLSFIFAYLFCSVGTTTQDGAQSRLTDKQMCHIIHTLPRMVPQLREAGINVSQAYYIWPRDAALHAKGEVLLEQYGYDPIRLDALETYCKAWFYVNYDSLIHERRKILSSIEEHLTENPYITDDQKRINIRILNKSLGHTKEEIRENIGDENIRKVKSYRDTLATIWQNVKE